MGMIVIMIRWVCFIDHAFRPAMPPAHNALPMRRGGGQLAKQRPPQLPWLASWPAIGGRRIGRPRDRPGWAGGKQH